MLPYGLSSNDLVLHGKTDLVSLVDDLRVLVRHVWCVVSAKFERKDAFTLLHVEVSDHAHSQLQLVEVWFDISVAVAEVEKLCKFRLLVLVYFDWEAFGQDGEESLRYHKVNENGHVSLHVQRSVFVCI